MPIETSTLTLDEFELAKTCLRVSAEVFRADAAAMKSVQSVRLSTAFLKQARDADELVEKCDAFDWFVLRNGERP